MIEMSDGLLPEILGPTPNIRLLMTFIAYSDEWMGVGLLAERSKSDPRTVKKYILHFINNGLIRKVVQSRETIYTFNLANPMARAVWRMNLEFIDAICSGD